MVRLFKLIVAHTVTMTRTNYRSRQNFANCNSFTCNDFQDFADITAEPTLESIPDPEQDGDDDDGSATSVTAHLTHQQMHQVCSIHRELFTELVQTSWIRIRFRSNHIDDESYREVLKDGYTTMAQLSDGVLPFLGRWLEFFY